MILFIVLIILYLLIIDVNEKANIFKKKSYFSLRKVSFYTK